MPAESATRLRPRNPTDRGKSAQRPVGPAVACQSVTLKVSMVEVRLGHDLRVFSDQSVKFSLARWLLRARDLAQSDTLPFT
jgi:hypothetical protein